jgi:hypothetical protein
MTLNPTEERRMGDHRISLTIKAEFHGKIYEIKDAWWNYQGHDGVDRRVIDFFERMWDDGYRRWADDVDAYHQQQKAKETEETERAELIRLKLKYEHNP